jgi:hypothetical protein
VSRSGDSSERQDDMALREREKSRDLVVDV